MKTKGYQDNFLRELIVDFFAGGGGASIGIELGRNAYGFEIKKDFYNDAKNKMLTNIQSDIFAALYEVKEQERRQAYANGQISLLTEYNYDKTAKKKD